MARSKSSPQHPSTHSTLRDVVTQLTEQVKELSGQVELLRNAIDEIREEFAWAIRNDKIGARMPDHSPSMMPTTLSENSLADDFGDGINSDAPQPDSPSSPLTPGELF